jgi:hypothetical protein
LSDSTKKINRIAIITRRAAYARRKNKGTEKEIEKEIEKELEEELEKTWEVPS